MKRNDFADTLKTKPKQTQSNPTCGEPACPEPVEGVESTYGEPVESTCGEQAIARRTISAHQTRSPLPKYRLSFIIIKDCFV